MMQFISPSPQDTPAIYRLLQQVRFHQLPEFQDAKPILENAHSLVLKEGDELVLWVCYHGAGDIFMDVVISPKFRRSSITRGLCREVLASGFNLSESGRLVVDCYNGASIKAAIKLGFSMSVENSDQPGMLRMHMTRAEFQRKYLMRG